MANAAIQRLTGEFARFQKNGDISLAVALRDDDVRTVRALIVGPPETPYEFGFFEFDLRFPQDYPRQSPSVRALTTNGGRTRFNPNIYSEGKVCLSILGTWRGESGEQWSSAQGLESVLLSIQSLMSPNPYENEPGLEEVKKDDAEAIDYIRKIRHETIRISILTRLEQLLNISPSKCSEGLVTDDERSNKRLKTVGVDDSQRSDSPMNAPQLTPPEANSSIAKSSKSAMSFSPPSIPQPLPLSSGYATPTNSSSTYGTPLATYEYDAEAHYQSLNPTLWDPFSDLIKRRFLWYYSTYLNTVAAAQREQKDATPFERTEFEYPPNSMEGNYQYANLSSRLRNVNAALEAEKAEWVDQGLKDAASSGTLANQLFFQFRQLQHKYNTPSQAGSRLELSLPDSRNPYLWYLTLFGSPEHNLDEGIFSLTLHIPPHFPHLAQPRVTMQTSIFHHRVSPATGALCYFPKNQESLESHLEALVEALEDEQPSFDPRACVHPEAWKLKWGSEDDKKMYRRKLRRSAQASTEG